jgi:hypothetical protein
MTIVTQALMGDPPPGRTPWSGEGKEGGFTPPSGPQAQVRTVAALPEQNQEVSDQLRAKTVIESAAPNDPTPGELSEETVRAVEEIGITGWEPKEPPTTAPLVEWMAPTDLLIDGAYQRNLSDKSVALISRICTGWDWRRFKPPIVAWTERGFEIIDGQHTAIAAATHPLIDRIPVLVVEAPELQARAAAFIGHNRDRLQVSPVQIHHAAVAAGDETAVTIQQVCDRAGARIVVSPYGSYRWKAGDTVAINGIAQLIDRRGAMRAREILQLLVEAGCAPVGANEIKSVELLLTDRQYADEIEPADLAAAIRACADTIDKDAKVFSGEHCVPRWRGVAAIWFRKCRKKKRA